VGQRAGATPITYKYVTDQSTYTIATGGTATVKIYLQETLNGNTSIINGNGENGLLGAGFELLSNVRPTNPSNITAVNPDSTDFNGSSPSHVNNAAVSNPNEADLTENITPTATVGVGLGNMGAPANSVFLGSVTIVGGSTPGTTTFNLGEFDINGFNSGNTITNPDGVDLDNSNNGGLPYTGPAYTGVGTTLTPFSVTTLSIPEPASTMLFAFGGIAALLRRRRKA
jgi:hypothetical protein